MGTRRSDYVVIITRHKYIEQPRHVSNIDLVEIPETYHRLAYLRGWPYCMSSQFLADDSAPNVIRKTVADKAGLRPCKRCYRWLTAE